MDEKPYFEAARKWLRASGLLSCVFRDPDKCLCGECRERTESLASCMIFLLADRERELKAENKWLGEVNEVSRKEIIKHLERELHLLEIIAKHGLENEVKFPALAAKEQPASAFEVAAQPASTGAVNEAHAIPE